MVLILIFKLLYACLNIFTVLLLINVVASWLIGFGILNMSNAFVSRLMDIVYNITEPVLTPVRNVIPSVGGLDLSPLIVFFALQGLGEFLSWLYWQVLMG